MKTDFRGQPPDGSARNSASSTSAALPKPSRRRILMLAAIVVLVVVGVFVARHALTRLILTRALSTVTGDRVTVGEFRIGMSGARFGDVRVTTANGDPLFTAAGIRVRYALDQLWGTRARRYGLRAVVLDQPVFTIVRHADGSYNLSRRGGGASSAASAATPWEFALRVRGGELRLIDRGALVPDLAEQRMHGVAIDGQVDSARRSVLAGAAVFAGRETVAAPLADWPLTLRATLDYGRGLAIARIAAPRLPLRGPIGFLQHSPAVRIDAGTLGGFVVRIYALDATIGRPLVLHVGGAADLRGGVVTVGALRRPVRDLRGHITLVDDGIWSPRLDGELAGLPLQARGGAFNRLAPVIRLAARADGDLRDLRRAFGFAQRQPVAGNAHVETLLEAPVSQILIRTVVRVGRGTYGRVPLSRLAGRVDYHAGTVVLDGVHGRYGAADVQSGGRFLLGRKNLDTVIVAAAAAPGRLLPYAENLAPRSTIDLVAYFRGHGSRFAVNGALGAAGGGTTGRGTFAINEYGAGEFGPFVLDRVDGSSVVGALRLERPTSRSAAWLSADRYAVNIPPTAAVLPGVPVPGFPPVAGTISGAAAGGGSPGNFALRGDFRGDDLRVAGAPLGSGSARLGGTLADLRLDGLALRGPTGAFRGTGAARAGEFALRGAYRGSLQALVPFTGDQRGVGGVRGDVLARLGSAGVVVQSSDAVFSHAALRGVALDSAAGTIAVRHGVFALIAASGSVGGAHAVAADANGSIAVSAPSIPARALRGTGLPLDAGWVSAYGLADVRARAPRFSGEIAVTAGSAHGYGVAGNAHVELAGSRATFAGGAGALGTTFGELDGTVAGVGEPVLGYALRARVPLADVRGLERALGIAPRHLDGTFSADLAIGGSGLQPSLRGRIDVPEGEYDGLGFRRSGATVDVQPGKLVAREGTLTVGSTTAAFGAAALGGAYALAVRAPAADLADFNDLFDTSGTLAGRGAIDVELRTGPAGPTTAGAIALRDAHVRAYPLGDVTLGWGMRRRTIAARAVLRSSAGTLSGTATITPAGGDLRRAFMAARYDAQATVDAVDLGRWLGAAGSSLPVTGFAAGRLQVDGRWPAVSTRLDAALRDGTVAGLKIASAHLRATSRGSRVAVNASDADLGFAALTGSGRLGLGPTDSLAFDLRLTSDDISAAVRRFVPASAGRDVAGALAADIRVGGTWSTPSIAGGFQLTGARYAGLAVPRATGTLTLAGKRIDLRAAEIELARGNALVTGSLPLVLQPFGIGPPGAAVSLDVIAQHIDVSEFIPLLPAGTVLGGTVDGRVGVEGTVDAPNLTGSLSIADGSYIGPVERAPITHVDARLDFSGTDVALRSFHAGLGSGTLDADADVRLPGRGRPTRYAANLRARAATFDLPAFGRGMLDGSLTLAGTGRTPLLSGAVELANAVIPVSAVYGAGSVAASSGLRGLPFDPRLAVTANAGANVRVRSAIVDVGVTGGVDLSGTLTEPRLSGGFTATDGTISSYNHVFRIVDAAVTFDPADGTTPTVAARAFTRVTNPDPDPSRNISGAANIYVTVSGTADEKNLQVTYSSDPAYSQEQIVGLLLDVPALLGAVNFNLNGAPSSPNLRGAPGETNVLLPPGITPEQVSAVSVNQEVFSLLNGQFTQRALSPLERTFEKGLGLSDIEFTIDYGGGIGYSLRRQIGQRDFYAFLSQTVTYPERVNLGFELVPKAYESLNFSLYAQNGVTSLITNQTPGEELFSSTRRLTSVQPLGNRAGVSINLTRRF